MIPRSLIAADRRHHLSARRKGALPASPGGPPSTGQKKLRVLNPILRLYRIQPTGKSFRMRVEMCWELVWQSAARSASCEEGCLGGGRWNVANLPFEKWGAWCDASAGATCENVSSSLPSLPLESPAGDSKRRTQSPGPLAAWGSPPWPVGTGPGPQRQAMGHNTTTTQ